MTTLFVFLLQSVIRIKILSTSEFLHVGEKNITEVGIFEMGLEG